MFATALQGATIASNDAETFRASYGLWWIEVVGVLVVLLCLGFVAREAAAFVSIARLRRRDGGVPVPRTKEEYLLLFPRACPVCLSRRGQRIMGWHRDQYGVKEFVDTWQCADCDYVQDGKRLELEAGTTEGPITAGKRWFISGAEARQIGCPRVQP